jgi:integrase
MVREQRVDIHDYERQYEHVQRIVAESELSPRNKALIFGYRDVCLRQGICGKVRLIRILGTLPLFARLLGKDFDLVTRPDVEQLISALLARNPPYSAQTIGTYKAIIRKFLSWVLQPNEFPTKHPPAAVEWITCHVRAREKRHLQRRDLLTCDEAARLLAVCDNARDRALVSTLWETGSRISETGNLQIKHVTKHQYGYLLDFTGKTGTRNPLVISSAPHLSAWLAYHPYADDPEAPLWVTLHHSAGLRYIRYAAIRKLLILLFQRAGINKRPNPHGLRHARTTHLVGTGLMNEAQAKSFLGWSQNSTMLGTYAHLTTNDANNAILAENRLAQPKAAPNALAVKQCRFCLECNPPSAAFCTKCSNPFDERAAHDMHHDQERTTQAMLELCAALVERGMLNEAVDAIHQARLGKALQGLLAKQDHQQRGTLSGQDHTSGVSHP